MPTVHGLLFKTMHLKFVRIIRMIYRLDMSKRTETLKILHFFLLNIFIFQWRNIEEWHLVSGRQQQLL